MMSERSRSSEDRAPSRRTESGKLPVFDYDRCKACGICAHFCPKKALEEGNEGYPRLSSPEVCNACRQCERLCPDFAVELVEGGEQSVPSDVAIEMCNAFLSCEE